MKLLHREDVIEAGYDLPNTGLCANIGQAELEELKFGGEWVLAQDETVVADGHEQRYLYMLVAGDVAISKKNDQGNSQQIATLGPGAAFGLERFLQNDLDLSPCETRKIKLASIPPYRPIARLQ